MTWAESAPGLSPSRLCLQCANCQPLHFHCQRLVCIRCIVYVHRSLAVFRASAARRGSQKVDFGRNKYSVPKSKPSANGNVERALEIGTVVSSAVPFCAIVVGARIALPDGKLSFPAPSFYTPNGLANRRPPVASTQKEQKIRGLAPAGVHGHHPPQLICANSAVRHVPGYLGDISSGALG